MVQWFDCKSKKRELEKGGGWRCHTLLLGNPLPGGAIHCLDSGISKRKALTLLKNTIHRLNSLQVEKSLQIPLHYPIEGD